MNSKAESLELAFKTLHNKTALKKELTVFLKFKFTFFFSPYEPVRHAILGLMGHIANFCSFFATDNLDISFSGVLILKQ